jgi:PAS domain S-box-containing protein
MSATSDRGPDPVETTALVGTVVEHSPLGLAVLNHAGTIRYTNPAFRRLLRLGPEGLSGRAVTALLPGAEPSTMAGLLKTLNRHEGDPGALVRPS